MLITLNIKNESMKESFLNFIKTLDYIDIKEEMSIRKNKKKDKFSEFAGMWKDNLQSTETIRDKAWKK